MSNRHVGRALKFWDGAPFEPSRCPSGVQAPVCDPRGSLRGEVLCRLRFSFFIEQ